MLSLHMSLVAELGLFVKVCLQCVTKEKLSALASSPSPLLLVHVLFPSTRPWTTGESGLACL